MGGIRLRLESRPDSIFYADPAAHPFCVGVGPPMEQAWLGDMVVDAEHRDHTTIASEVLAYIGWLS